jgi:tetratricopeptide (TPR) repeat protein
MSSDKEAKNIPYINEVYELHQQADNLIDSNPADALKIARKIQNYGSNHFIAYTVSGLFIDIGSRLNDEELIKEGILLLQNNLTKITSKQKLVPTAYYNLANGFSCLFRVKRGKNPSYGYFEDTEVKQAKEFFRKALEQRIDNPQLKSQIYVNLGNCYDEVGRAVEAQDCYTEALKLNPEHGMALGNKGQGLFFYAALSGEHQGTILKEAYTLLSQAIEREITQEARTTFVDYMRRIELQIKDKQFFDKSFDGYPGYKIQAESDLDEFLIRFCLEHKLYLNICNFCQKCDAAIGDTAIIRKMIAKPNDYSFLILSSYLNHIKQEYITARFLLVLSQYKGMNLDFVDKNVKLINSLDYTRHNVYIQLIKEAFQSFYNLLDKIACFINDYLKLGVAKNDVSFRKIWYSDWEKRAVRESIKNTRNPALNALFDIHRDLENGAYVTLRYSRNALTHRFLNVKAKLEKQDEENMLEETLLQKTTELAKIVRSAIIYVLFFIYLSEKVKEKTLKGKVMPLDVNELPDSLRKRL